MYFLHKWDRRHGKEKISFVIVSIISVCLKTLIKEVIIISKCLGDFNGESCGYSVSTNELTASSCCTCIGVNWYCTKYWSHSQGLGKIPVVYGCCLSSFLGLLSCQGSENTAFWVLLDLWCLIDHKLQHWFFCLVCFIFFFHCYMCVVHCYDMLVLIARIISACTWGYLTLQVLTWVLKKREFVLIKWHITDEGPVRLNVIVGMNLIICEDH